MADDGEGQPPSALQMAWWCGDAHLPDVGGMLDQDYRLIYEMRTLERIYNVVMRWRNLAGKNIHSLTTNERRLLRYLINEGFM